MALSVAGCNKLIVHTVVFVASTAPRAVITISLATEGSVLELPLNTSLLPWVINFTHVDRARGCPSELTGQMLRTKLLWMFPCNMFSNSILFTSTSSNSLQCCIIMEQLVMFAELIKYEHEKFIIV